MPSGKGKFEYSNGDVFNGVFVDGVMSGYGEMIKATGEIY